ncbi:hypothetical protein KYE71_08865 [Bifidobacterium pseudocatenulatum]|uniref:hypothetical protein n=1 Tax=Bifidobacterium pseudocatenulatum TaxID=28026 RepID=UPI00080BB18E|nr:hypothetical protein [Bifidobacterium pseudocatenulatum]UDG84539.1 hypothetical protein KYE71_08865 [Bifidobacterium pseudocatenulatum]
MGKKENRQLIGLRMRSSEIKRRRYELDKKYGRIGGVCPICGKLIRKPKRGPTARFCSSSCRQAYARRKQAAIEFRKDKSVDLAVGQLAEQANDYREKADRIRNRTLNAQREIKQVRKTSRLACMFQLKTILERDPELIENAPSNGYVAGLMDDIDRQGRSGDAERLLRHNGYTGPMPPAGTNR